MRVILLAFLSAQALLFLGCKGPCQALSDKLCECTANSTAKAQCQQTVAQAEATYARSSEQEAYCQSLLEVCDCKKITTAEGKKNCGLADP